MPRFRGEARIWQACAATGLGADLHGSYPTARRCSCLGSRRGLQLANVAARRLRTAVHGTALQFRCGHWWSWLLSCSPSAGVRGRGPAFAGGADVERAFIAHVDQGNWHSCWESSVARIPGSSRWWGPGSSWSIFAWARRFCAMRWPRPRARSAHRVSAEVLCCVTCVNT